MEICRYCRQAGCDDVTPSYWLGGAYPCHRACKVEGYANEAYECQKIDADCNDCKHFKREKHLSKGGKGIWQGQCLKFDCLTLAYPNFCSNKQCFEHRKD